MDKNNYDFLLTNLLDINNNDSSLYCSVDNEKFFDIFKMSGEKTFEKICSRHDFNILFNEFGHKDLMEKVRLSQTPEEVFAHYTDFDLQVPEESVEKIQTDFEHERQQLVTSLETRFQKSITKWKKILKKAQDINIETNIWPLHVGFFFVGVNTEKKEIFAPLFFKEVTIEVKNSQVYLKSASEVKVNSKLVAFLQQFGYSLDTTSYDFTNKSIYDVYNYFKNSWNKIFKIPENFKAQIPKVTANFLDKNIVFHEGLILGFFNVSSGYLWNQMKKIIENDELDEILATNFNKNTYRNKVDDVIFNKNFKLFKIQKTNFSQDCATVSALYQDTVIWGPPGTGKSQTISNLLANILSRDRTALVVSQKRAALEVLRTRLKDLSIFCIFILNDKNLKLDVFYDPLKNFLNKVENFKDVAPEDNFEIMPRIAKRYVELAREVKNIPDYENVISTYGTMFAAEINQETIEDLKQLDPYLKYNINPSSNDYAEIVKELYELNLEKKQNAVFSMINFYPKNIKEAASLIAKNPNLLKIDINGAIKNIHTIDIDSLKKIDEFYKFQLNNKTMEINSSKTLAKMLIKRTVDKMSSFTEEEQKEYRDFALSVRSGNMKPFKFFHRHKNMIKKLFSIIVTTPDTDLSMWNKNEFDYAVLDESSQIFLEKGIPILYLAKRKILAGDDKQMQPTKWFSASYATEEDDDFGNIESLLDYALARGVYKVLLDKNYRSKRASLMTFSSKLFYDSKLDVIDDYLIDNKEKTIEVIQTDGIWDNSLNEKEANLAIEKVLENIDKYKKVILLVFNAKQQEYIFNKIFAEYPELESALQEDRLSLKNIENIQGDEADLVIISVVYDATTNLSSTYVARPGGKNALNVAISRAKEKMIVIKSIFADDIKLNETSSKDLIVLREWLRFLDLNETKKKNYIDTTVHDDWTRTTDIDTSLTVIDEIYRGLQPLVKKYSEVSIEVEHSIGTKKISIALVEEQTKNIIVGFMIDDYPYAGDGKQYIKFFDKLNFLYSKNYPILLVSEIDWKVNKKAIVEDVENRIKKYFGYTENKIQEITIPQNQEVTQEIELSENPFDEI
ncbi:AAA domain-containing protein [[Mycoplasma] gypis]|uniref:DEAD/DEAH box helicase n=1 Tax=[Mycoplasma] gypis TaxID=92404 RepID=A0ABZ2RVN1_9BACT|nr:DEAD/DEAH box helicase [[Mycoplasma] gypis]MBN0919507.1 DNA2/NAM7 family helicase [[Mycoplasma] gypis]